MHPVSGSKITKYPVTFQKHFSLTHLTLFHIIRKSLTPNFRS
ncbi:hypothetical protein BDI4_210157 [Burkholderia diffusa]|nr:hypothetical protein BDI4_210157 [Burkholderia diffusa]